MPAPCLAVHHRHDQLNFDQAKNRSAPNVSGGPSHLAARPKGVAAQRRVWGSQEGAREPYGALAPFCPCRGHGILRPPKAANGHAHLERKVASSGEPLYRRKISHLLAVKQKEHSSPPPAAPLYRRKVYPLLRVRRRGRHGLPDRRFLTLKKIFGVFSKKRLTLSLAYANLYTG